MTDPARSTTLSDAEAATFEANLTALRLRDPLLARRVEEAQGHEGISVTRSASGAPTARLRIGARDIALASAHNPLQEASRLIDAHDTQSISAWIVLGCALAYHVEELHRRTDARCLIFVAEADLGVFRRLLETRDVTGLINADRVRFLVALDKTEVFEALQPFLATLFLGSRYVPHPPSLDAFPAEYARFSEIMRDFFQYGETYFSTFVSINLTSKRNMLQNLPEYCFSPGLNDLAGLFAGYPAVVVSAGPSLSRNIDQLHLAKGRAVVIAVSTSLKPLLAKGIVPDFVCMIDYDELSRKYFTGLEEYPRVPMVADPKGDWHTLDAHPGPKRLMFNPFPETLLKGIDIRKAQLKLGATVAHVAFYFAQFLGADPIVFVGQDLGFPDNVTYTPGTATHDLWQLDCSRFRTMEMNEWERIVRVRPTLRKVRDIHGNEIYTDAQMFAYLQQFEWDFQRAKETIIDATEGGARKAGSTVMTFAEAFEKHFAREIPGDVIERARKPALGCVPLSARPNVLAKLDARIGEAEEVSKFYGRSLDVLKRIRENLDDASRAEEFQRQVEMLRRQVDERREINALVADVAQGNEYLRHKVDREIASANPSPDERKRRQIERDVSYVQGLLDASEMLVEMLKSARERVERYVPYREGASEVKT